MANYKVEPEGGCESFQILSMEGCYSHVAFWRLLWGRWVIENVSLVESNPVYMIAFLQLGSLFAHPPQTVRPCSDFWSGNGGGLVEEMKMTASEKREDKYACTKKL